MTPAERRYWRWRHRRETICALGVSGVAVLCIAAVARGWIGPGVGLALILAAAAVAGLYRHGRMPD